MQAPSRSAAIAAELRDEILRGRYRSGDRLPSERELAERFSAHRGAVREALKCLEQLGLTDIRPGGARVCPIEQASLDVVAHLLVLEDPPDSSIVSDVLEVVGGIFSVAARLCAERANDEQRESIQALLLEIEASELPTHERIEQIQRLGDLFVEASGNMVLGLVRRGVNTRFIEVLEESRPRSARPLGLDPDVLHSIGRAIGARDGAGAADAVSRLTHDLRRHALQTIEDEREQLLPSERAQS
jgi:DNA-binding FadR family transcriptional regulator